MVIRFDRENAPGERAESHYSGFVLPSCAALSELMALLPERCDLLKARGTVWEIFARVGGGRLFYMSVDREGSYSFGLLTDDAPARSVLPKGEIFGRLHCAEDFLLGDARYLEILKEIN